MRGNDIISLSYILRLHMEMAIFQNARAISEFYPHDFFHEGAISEIFFLKSFFFDFFEKSKR